METDCVITGDNAKVLATFPPDCIDLTVTSPPYDNLRTYNGFSFDFETVARELYRVTKPGGVVVWVVGDATIDGSETLTSFRQALFFRECGFNVETMIYQKNGVGAVGSNNYYWQSFEYMFVFSKGAPKTHNLLSDRRNRKSPQKVTWVQGKRHADGTLKGKRTWEMRENGIRFNVWLYDVGKNSAYSDNYAVDHPAVFPEQLANDHILSWSNPGDIVLDPFAGSGTTLKKAKELGRRYIGIEISADYVSNIIEKRLAATNPPLFV